MTSLFTKESWHTSWKKSCHLTFLFCFLQTDIKNFNCNLRNPCQWSKKHQHGAHAFQMERDVSKSDCWFCSWHSILTALFSQCYLFEGARRPFQSGGDDLDQNLYFPVVLPPSQFLLPGQNHLHSNHVLQGCCKVRIVPTVITAPLTSKLGFHTLLDNPS